MKQMNNEIIYPRSEEEVLLILATAKKEGHLLEIIFDEFVKKPFSMPVLWGCRAYFYGLKKEELSAHPVLFTHLALLSAMDGDLSQAKAYVQFMGKTPRLVKMDTYDMMDICRIKTELVMPYISDAMFFRIVSFLIEEELVPVMGLTLSACRPSILNGFRDFTRYGKYLKKSKDRITEAACRLYGGSVGQKVYEIMLAEWYYQNNNCFEALILVTGTIPLIEQEKDMRCLFVALALQMKILLVNGQTKDARPLVEKIRKRIQVTGWDELTSSLDAIECLGACYDGRLQDVERWLDDIAPDENKGIFMMDMYGWLRCDVIYRQANIWLPMY